MTEEDQVLEVARLEVENRSLALTRQLLGPHSLPRHADGRPVVSRIRHDDAAGCYIVYFPLHAEPYNCAVTVRKRGNDDLCVIGVQLAADVRVVLGIYGGAITPAEVTARTGLVPSETHLAGDHRYRDRVYPEHVWRLEALPGTPASVEEKLESLLRSIEPATAAIASLRPSAQVQIAIVYKGWSGNPQFGGMSVSADAVAALARLGADLDFDLYAYGPPMPEDAGSDPSVASP